MIWDIIKAGALFTVASLLFVVFICLLLVWSLDLEGILSPNCMNMSLCLSLCSELLPMSFPLTGLVWDVSPMDAAEVFSDSPTNITVTKEQYYNMHNSLVTWFVWGRFVCIKAWPWWHCQVLWTCICQVFREGSSFCVVRVWGSCVVWAILDSYCFSWGIWIIVAEYTTWWLLFCCWCYWLSCFLSNSTMQLPCN